MDFSAYEKGNPFMSYNHIQICKVDPDCCVVKVNLVAESMNLHGHVHGGLLYAMADCVAGIFARMDGRVVPCQEKVQIKCNQFSLF